MKRAVLAMLAPLAGCNWVFGLEPTHAAPDAPDAPPPGVLVHVALLVETLGANGSPTAPMETAFPDLARLQAGTLAGGATEMLTAGADGTIGVPMEIATMPWRLIYQRAGGVVREYQNLPAEAHVIEALLGPVTRAPPPAGSGYVITPTSYTGSHATNRVYTLGAWTEGKTVVVGGGGAALDYDLPGAMSMSGPMATPKAPDRGLLIDYVVDGASGCLSSTGSTDFPAEINGGSKAPVGGPWLTQPSQPNVNVPLGLGNNNIAPFGEPDVTARDQYGYLATTDVPLFTRAPDISRSLLLPNPPMVMLRSCPVTTTPPPALQEPIWLKDHFRPAVHTEFTASRTISGVTLTNGVAVVTLGAGTPPVFNVGTTVAFADAVKLDATDLFASDSVPVTPASGPMTLSWSKKSGSTKADFWEVALVRISSGVQIRERVYVTTKESVTIQPADLSAGLHVFEISAYTGRAPAMNGDFRAVTGDQEMSVIHSRTFVVQ